EPIPALILSDDASLRVRNSKFSATRWGSSSWLMSKPVPGFVLASSILVQETAVLPCAFQSPSPPHALSLAVQAGLHASGRGPQRLRYSFSEQFFGFFREKSF